MGRVAAVPLRHAVTVGVLCFDDRRNQRANLAIDFVEQFFVTGPLKMSQTGGDVADGGRYPKVSKTRTKECRMF